MGLPGVLSLAGTPLLLDGGHTLPPGEDALSHGRGLDVSLGAALGSGGAPGGSWVLSGWWGPVPSLRDFLPGGFLLCQPRCFPWPAVGVGWVGTRVGWEQGCPLLLALAGAQMGKLRQG